MVNVQLISGNFESLTFDESLLGTVIAWNRPIGESFITTDKDKWEGDFIKLMGDSGALFFNVDDIGFMRIPLLKTLKAEGEPG